jgi:hypothetical protein
MRNLPQFFEINIIIISLFIINFVNRNLLDIQKYCVFSAPPETNQDLVEIPARETEYPFYECNSEVENNHEAVLIPIFRTSKCIN